MARRLIDPTARTYEELRDGFAWGIPEWFNMGVACADDHPVDDVALVTERVDGSVTQTRFGELSTMSDAVAAGLLARGVGPGDRVGVVAPQSLETGLAHLACWKAGAISLPLATLFGPDALGYRIEDAGARLVVAAPGEVSKLAEAVPDVAIARTDLDIPDMIGVGGDGFRPADVRSREPAYLIYTSGTTGPPKGALHAHRSLFGHLPGFELYYELAPQPGDVIWTPADWAWIGGLMDVLVPAWYFGMTVLTAEHDFDPVGAVELMVRHGVTLAFLPPTALKMMRAAGVSGEGLSLRAVFSGGEPLGEEIHRWASEELGVVINEGYGQTECNLVVGNCASRWPVRPGSMGKALPGHDVAVLDESGIRLIGQVGEICVREPDPVMMLEYWNRPEATERKYRDGWLLTGDLGVEDSDGYLWFRSRADDVILSRGYRIGPGEIEDSLLAHPDVAMAAVVGIPDEVAGEVPAAWIVTRRGVHGDETLARALADHVRTRLAAHEVPRRITFVDDLPRTTTGKIKRRALRDG